MKTIFNNIVYFCVLLLFSLEIAAQGGGGSPCHFDDLSPEVQQSLTVLYNATNGNTWQNNNNWFSPAPVDMWEGIQMGGGGADECKVVNINLHGNNLSGNIPTNLNLPDLVRLDLSDNNLTGSIPNFNQLPSLEDLYLDNNHLTGTLPNFDNLPFLEWLYVGRNHLVGSMPNFTELPNLVFLQVCPNNFVGGVPNFENCTNLNISQIDFSCLSKVSVSGTVFYDSNNNCTQDANEPGIPNLLISANSNQQLAYTNANGYYQLAVDTGSVVVQTNLSNNLFWQQQAACPQTYTVQTNSYDDVIVDQNFALTAAQTCASPTVAISVPLLRRCFDNTYTVSYCNEGSDIANNAQVAIELPNNLQFISATLPHTQANNVYSFALGNLAIGQCGSFYLLVQPLCDAELGSAACVKASIYPPACILNTLDGYQLNVESVCQNDTVRFNITNQSDTDMPSGSNYRLYEDDILSAIGTVQLQAHQTQTLNIDATGATYRLIADANATNPIVSQPQAFTEGCGGYHLGFVLPFATPDNEPFIDIDCHEIIGSLDPNDLQVAPLGLGNNHYIQPNTPLEYTLRFQNTGNDTAINVFLVDTLAANRFDLSTLRICNSTHPYTYELRNNQTLVAYFDNIYLPDSSTNQAGSNGYIKYTIQPKSNLEQGDVLENQAYLFFDYNPPIATNTVFYTICNNEQTMCMPTGTVDTLYFSVGINNINTVGNAVALRVYPNPANSSVNFDWINLQLPTASALQIDIKNLLGQTVQSAPINNLHNNIAVQHLPAGIYTYTVLLNQQPMANGRLVVY